MKTTTEPVSTRQESFNRRPTLGLKFDFNFIVMAIVLVFITFLYVVEFRRILATSVQTEAYVRLTANELVSQ